MSLRQAWSAHVFCCWNPENETNQSNQEWSEGKMVNHVLLVDISHEDSHDIYVTPWKINMEHTNHPFRKENDLPNLHDYVPC